jgi:hypothetical protein
MSDQRRWNLEALAFDEPTNQWLSERSEREIDAINAFVEAHEHALYRDCSDGPNLVLDTGTARDEMYAAEYSCCGWAQSRLRLDEWEHDLIVGSCHGH